jgi:hypothetical protein
MFDIYPNQVETVKFVNAQRSYATMRRQDIPMFRRYSHTEW